MKNTNTNTKPQRSLLELLNEKRADKIPAGWLSLAELAKAEDANPLSNQFKDVVSQAVKAGILLRRPFKSIVRVGDGTSLRSVLYYKRALN